MKSSAIRQKVIWGFTVITLTIFMGGSAGAQMPGGDKNASGMNAAMIKLFAPNTNFISHADVHVQDNKTRKETTTMPMGFDMLGNKVRVDINITQVKSKDMSPAVATAMKNMGMDQMINIVHADQKAVISIYPSLKAYAQTPMSKEEIDDASKDYKITKTLIGKETIDGHACEKKSVVLTDDKGATQKAITWEAADLRGFPVQIQIAGEESTLLMKFKDIKLGRPDISLFEPPAGMAKFDTVNALMMDAASKKMNTGNVK